jgi:hypothetical protein
MREELLGPKVENVAVAIVQEKGENDHIIYNTYLFNLKDNESINKSSAELTIVSIVIYSILKENF